MTLQQLKYVTTVAQTGTISDAAKKLFISQPSLTKAVRELEKEMEITIFERTNRGIVEDDRNWWGYPHLYYPSNPAFVEHFVQAARLYHRERNAK